MKTRYILISLPDRLEDKFKNLLKNFNAVNRGNGGITIEESHLGYKPTYAAIPKED